MRVVTPIGCLFMLFVVYRLWIGVTNKIEQLTSFYNLGTLETYCVISHRILQLLYVLLPFMVILYLDNLIVFIMHDWRLEDMERSFYSHMVHLTWIYNCEVDKIDQHVPHMTNYRIFISVMQVITDSISDVIVLF